MRKNLKILLTALLITMAAISFAGCKSKDKKEAENTQAVEPAATEAVDSQKDAQDVSDGNQSENESAAATADMEETDTEDNCGDGEYELEFDVQTEADYIPMIAGTWEYYGRGNGPDEDVRLSITFNEDGTYEAVQTLRTMPKQKDLYSVEGTWIIDHLYREDFALPDCMTLDVNRSTNPRYSEIDSFGDFIADNFGIIEGRYVMGMRQVNTNGLSLFEMNDSCPVLYKCMDEAVKAPAFKPSKDGKFNGVVWRVDYNDDKAVVWLADYSQSNYSKINVVTRYECDVKGAGDFPIEAFDDGIHLVKVSTDADGKIVSISPRYDALDKGVEEFYIKPTSNKITDYVKKVCDYSVTDASGTTIKAYYEKPIFGGTDKGVRALNDAIDKMEKNYAKTVSGDILKRELDDLLGFASPNAEYKYSPVRLYSVYYDNNVASVGFDSDWYMGGVYNVMYSGVNIDLNTGRRLGIDEVMDMSMPYVKDVIAQALDEQYDVDKQYALSKLTEMQNIPFWFDDNYIYVGFGSYELEMGTGYCVVYIDR